MSVSKKIIAIGGGEIGRPGFPVETTKIDQEIIALSRKKKPKLLFIPTASSDSHSYFEIVRKHFGLRLGCVVTPLYLLDGRHTKSEISRKILSADIIYVGGGNTLKMMKAWRRFGVDRALERAYRRGVVLSGVSAGAICWFSFGNSDSLRFSQKNAPMIKVGGLGLIGALFCPHYDVEKKRAPELKRIMKNTRGVVAVAVDNCAALEILDDQFRVISSKSAANAYKVFWEKGVYRKGKILKTKEFLPLGELLSK